MILFKIGYRSFSRGKLCKRSIKCSKQNQHRGKCDSKRLPKVQLWKFTRKSLVCQKEKEVKEQFQHEAERLQCERAAQTVKERYLQLKNDELEIKSKEIARTSETLVAEALKQRGASSIFCFLLFYIISEDAFMFNIQCCEQPCNNLLTICNKFYRTTRLVTRLFGQL